MKLREQAKKKLKKQGGFTLIEMLIVVAIIAILVAVAIPIVSSALNKTKVATDQANERSAKSLATIAYLNGNLDYGTGDTATMYMNVDTGALEKDVPSTKYGKCSKHSGGYLQVVITKSTGDIKVTWAGVTDTSLHGLSDAETTSD
jgi:type IV pilus assembly protein PilA